jgi:hypothetical protein
MKRVEQKCEDCCGAACVAIIARISHCAAVKRLGTSGPTTAFQLRKALRFYGFNLGNRESLKGKKYSDLKQNGLLFARIREIKGKDAWEHWMVWDAGSQAILDPAKRKISSRWTRLNAFFPVARRKAIR